MCGIVGYTGPREAGPILIEGLKRLEYRGYDSAGIALIDDSGRLFVEKRAGKLANLQTAIADRTPHAAIGLAHTRWATHGRPNDLNAHPHQDCTGEITVVHNGISVAEVVAAIDGAIGLTQCSVHAEECERTNYCPTRPHWAAINRAVGAALSAISLAEMIGPLAFAPALAAVAEPVAHTHV